MGERERKKEKGKVKASYREDRSNRRSNKRGTKNGNREENRAERRGKSSQGREFFRSWVSCMLDGRVFCCQEPLLRRASFQPMSGKSPRRKAEYAK